MKRSHTCTLIVLVIFAVIGILLCSKKKIKEGLSNTASPTPMFPNDCTWSVANLAATQSGTTTNLCTPVLDCNAQYNVFKAWYDKSGPFAGQYILNATPVLVNYIDNATCDYKYQFSSVATPSQVGYDSRRVTFSHN